MNIRRGIRTLLHKDYTETIHSHKFHNPDKKPRKEEGAACSAYVGGIVCGPWVESALGNSFILTAALLGGIAAIGIL